jgi:hypothetical protein
MVSVRDMAMTLSHEPATFLLTWDYRDLTLGEVIPVMLFLFASL